MKGGTGARFWIAVRDGTDLNGEPRPLGSPPQSWHFVTGCYRLSEAKRYMHDWALPTYAIYDWRKRQWIEP
jgi:hypothetical protein